MSSVTQWLIASLLLASGMLALAVCVDASPAFAPDTAPLLADCSDASDPSDPPEGASAATPRLPRLRDLPVPFAPVPCPVVLVDPPGLRPPARASPPNVLAS